MPIGSFLRKLAGPAAGIATSLIPGVGPALAPIVGGAVGSLANRGGGSSGGNGTTANLPPVDEQYANQRRDIAGNLHGLQTTATENAGQFLTGAQGDIAGARGFYSNLASGNPAAVASALAPQLNQARTQSQNAINQIQEFAPRGGGRNAALSTARIARAGTLSGILGQAPYLGAQGLTNLAQTGGNLGLGAGNLGVNAGTASSDIGLAGENLTLNRARVGQGQQDIDLRKRQQNMDLYGGLGSSIADILGSTGIAGKIGKRLSGLFAPKGPAPDYTNIPLSAGVRPSTITPGPITDQYATGYKAARGNRTIASPPNI